MYTTQAPNPNLAPFSLQGQDLADPSATFNAGDMDKQKMLAKLLMASGSKQQSQTQYVDGWAVPQSGAQGLNSLAQGLTSAYMMGSK